MKQSQSLWIILGIVVLGLLALLPLFRPWSISTYPGYSMYSMMTGGMFFGMTVFWILLVIFCILGIIWFSQQISHQRRR